MKIKPDIKYIYQFLAFFIFHSKKSCFIPPLPSNETAFFTFYKQL